MKRNIVSFILVFILLIVSIGVYVFIRSQKSQPSFDRASVPTEDTVTPYVTGVQNSKPADHSPVVNEISLTVTSPVDGATVQSSSVTIIGKTAPKAEVFINEAETMADASGNFSKTIALDEGDNIVIVVANDAKGNVAEQDLTINYDSGQ